MTQAQQIEDLIRLKDMGGLTEEEFVTAKTRILNTLGKETDLSLTENLSRKVDTVGDAFAGSLNENDAAWRKLLWILYWVVVASNVIGLFPFFLWVSAIAWIAAVIIAALKLSPSKDTIYNSHFKNIVLTAVLSAASLAFFFVVTVLTFGLGLIITIPVIIAAFIWFVYRIVKGMMRLNEGRAM